MIPILSSLLSRIRCAPPQPVYPVVLPSTRGTPRGTVLLCYMPEALTCPENAARLKGHPNFLTSRVVARIFLNLGYNIEAIRWDDRKFKPKKHYEVIFDISSNLPRLVARMNTRPVCMLLRTGADAFFQNAAEMRRIRAMEARRHVDYCPKRLVQFPDLERKSLEMADTAILLGNEWTRQTYPAALQERMHIVPAVVSDNRDAAKTHDYVPAERHFLCFSGAGAVHKGADLLLEVFGRHPELTLHVVGNTTQEPDFARAYRRELAAGNIHCHGFLHPDDPRFTAILKTCFASMLPSCSEGTSVAAVTCLQLGLYPILSREAGVTLPQDCGHYLEQCSIEEIEHAVVTTYQRPAAALENEILSLQSHATKVYSLDAFTSAMEPIIQEALDIR